METLTTKMTVPSASQSSENHNQSGGSMQSISVLAVVPTLSQISSEAGATVYVAGSATPKPDSTIIWSSVSPKVQLTNGSGSNSTTEQSSSSLSSSSPDTQHHLSLQQQPAHVVKIKINPGFDNSRVISTVRLTPDQIDPRDSKTELDECCTNKRNNIERVCATSIVNSNVNNVDTYVRINVVNDTDHHQLTNHHQQSDEMIQPGLSECANNNTTTTNRSSTCFYFSPFPNSISTMSSGQCSPSDTLDSGTCSDLDSTPPPLPKKKISSTVLTDIKTSGQHNRTGSLTSSGADVDSDDNESNISCDSLNSGELAARTIAEQTLTSGVDISSEKSRNLLTNDINTVMMNDGNVIAMPDLVESVDHLERNNLSSNKHNNKSTKSNNINNNNNNNNDDYDNNVVNDVNENSEKLSSCMADGISSGQNSLSVSPSPSSTSSLSKSSSTPRVRSPNPLANGHCLQSTSPVVKECTYEDRKKEQKRLEQENATAEHYANYNRNNGTKYVYEDDRFYKFHINELEPDNNNDNNDNNNVDKKNKFDETEEYFAGYKILDKEAIRSAKGTVRGVKNRVRAGIATFLQNPSSKNYKQKDAGKVVVYTTSMRVVTKTMIACMKMRQILNTHMVQYEERDLFGSREYQAELKERLDIELVEVPQLFIDGQHIGDADAVERLNESEELRPMLKPYKYRGVRKVCPVCGGANAIPCISCHGSKKSWRWNGFLNEVFALRCMNCDEVGLIRCPSC